MSHLSNAAESMAAVARTITDDQLANKTPCTEYDVRALVNHLLFWGPSLAGAGRKESVPQPAAAESDVDLAAGDWRGRLLALLDDITSSWAPPSAWEGETSMGTPHTLPAPVMGAMIVGEAAVHGWDLAVATGQRLELPADLLAHLHDTMFAGVEQGREMGMYGPEVAVPADAPTLDRILGLAGRDPAWALSTPTGPACSTSPRAPTPGSSPPSRPAAMTTCASPSPATMPPPAWAPPTAPAPYSPAPAGSASRRSRRPVGASVRSGAVRPFPWSAGNPPIPAAAATACRLPALIR